jgi:two-component system LytT family response regulator
MSNPDTLRAVRTLICEDEPLARRAIREYLRGVEWIDIVGEAANGNDAMRLLHKLEPDLVFMDVRMPGMSGIDVLDVTTHRSAVVFTTAYDEYAVTAFELGAVDYLVKPFGKDRLLETLSRVRLRLVGEGIGRASAERGGSTPAETSTSPVGSPKALDRIFARRKGSMVPVLTADIIRIDATSGGAEIVTPSGRYDLDATLGEIEARLDADDFVRIHRSHIVNLAHVVSIRRYDERRLDVTLADDSSVVASRQGSKALKGLMN